MWTSSRPDSRNASFDVTPPAAPSLISSKFTGPSVSITSVPSDPQFLLAVVCKWPWRFAAERIVPKALRRVRVRNTASGSTARIDIDRFNRTAVTGPIANRFSVLQGPQESVLFQSTAPRRSPQPRRTVKCLACARRRACLATRYERNRYLRFSLNEFLVDDRGMRRPACAAISEDL